MGEIEDFKPCGDANCITKLMCYCTEIQKNREMKKELEKKQKLDKEGKKIVDKIVKMNPQKVDRLGLNMKVKHIYFEKGSYCPIFILEKGIRLRPYLFNGAMLWMTDQELEDYKQNIEKQRKHNEEIRKKAKDDWSIVGWFQMKYRQFKDR